MHGLSNVDPAPLASVGVPPATDPAPAPPISRESCDFARQLELASSATPSPVVPTPVEATPRAASDFDAYRRLDAEVSRFFAECRSEEKRFRAKEARLEAADGRDSAEWRALQREKQEFLQRRNQQLLEFQIRAGDVQFRLQLVSKAVEQATTGTKTILQTQA